jgi:hypothetical protein
VIDCKQAPAPNAKVVRQPCDERSAAPRVPDLRATVAAADGNCAGRPWSVQAASWR